MDSEESFEVLIQRLHDGEDLAAQLIFNAYSSRLICLARRRLAAKIRQKVGPEDVVQSVFRSFFVRQGRGSFDLRDWDSLWGLLVAMTLNKCGHQIDRYLTHRRSVNREVSDPQGEDNAQKWAAIAREPSPSEALALNETLEECMRMLSPRDQQILVLKLQGASTSEISAEAGRSERTVERVLGNVRDQLLSAAKENSIR